jgi:hypothetical protein
VAPSETEWRASEDESDGDDGVDEAADALGVGKGARVRADDEDDGGSSAAEGSEEVPLELVAAAAAEDDDDEAVAMVSPAAS